MREILRVVYFSESILLLGLELRNYFPKTDIPGGFLYTYKKLNLQIIQDRSRTQFDFFLFYL